jgi:hypothetical protein
MRRSRQRTAPDFRHETLRQRETALEATGWRLAVIELLPRI